MTSSDGPEEIPAAPPSDGDEHDGTDEPGLALDGSGPQELSGDER